MTRALQKHVARRQDQTFADWFAELRELAGERWADVSDQAPTVYAVWGGGATPAHRRHNDKHLPGSRQWFFAECGGTTVENEAWDSMKRVNGLLTVAKCFAAKGVEKDDNPVWIAGAFSMLLDLIEEAFDEAMCSARAEAKRADDRPAA